MSYDYWLFRLRCPVSKTRDVDEDTIDDFTQWEQIRSKLAELLPEVIWRDSDAEYYGDGGPLHIGRFEISIKRDMAVDKDYNHPFGMFWIYGSYHVDQRDIVLKIAKTVDFSVLDFQSGEVLYLQKTFGEYKAVE